MSEKQEQSSLTLMDGIIFEFDDKKGFGFIKDSKGRRFFFHISDIVDIDKSIPVEGQKVVFESVPSQKKTGFFDAKKVSRQWNTGVIVNILKDKNCGFIRIGAMEESIFFNLNNYRPSGETPKRGSYVGYCVQPEDEAGLRTSAVTKSRHLVGVIKEWNEKIGGKIRPSQGGNLITFSWKDIILPRKEGYRRLREGDSVTFILRKNNDNEAVLVRKEYPLRVFADLGNENKMLSNLADKALEEDWSYTNSTAENNHQILWNYLFNTFQRLEEEDRDCDPGNEKIKIAEGDNGSFVAIFNTGLVDKYYKVIYVIFTEKASKSLGEPRWVLAGFCARGDKINRTNYLTYFKDLPKRAEYFTDSSDLLYNFNLRLDAVTEHILGDRDSRLPESIKKRIPDDMKDHDQIISFLNSHLQMAIERALERIKWNYKAAIPQYYNKEKKIQLLLPLCIDDPRHVDVALAVQRENKAYVGYTILELDWAYSNARLIAKPDSDWLSPNKISSKEVDTDEIED